MAQVTHIRVRYSSDGLFGATNPAEERIDEAASVRTFGEYLVAALYDEYPDAEIVVEYGINDDHSANGQTDTDEAVDIGYIVNKVWESYSWIEGTDEFDNED